MLSYREGGYLCGFGGCKAPCRPIPIWMPGRMFPSMNMKKEVRITFVVENLIFRTTQLQRMSA
ncbi:MAG: hypothetical protein UU31_C0001G0027 [Candidatus Uhrbacteria bacterium GW2011_GWA2_41_10]|nr:MAG: hypothetical protein UU31_C0001G0027 [Candidatus Uhrbacteria bacterium GW2011_GWA2_41_10]